MEKINNLISHECPHCGHPHLSLFIMLNKGSRFCKKCGKVILFDNFFWGGMGLVLMMLGFAFMKSTLVGLVGSEMTIVIFIVFMILLFLVGTRVVFRVKPNS